MSSLDSEAKPDNAGHSVLALTTSHSLVVSSLNRPGNPGD